MCQFLEPLSEATDMLCKSNFPTFHQVVPIYIAVIERLKMVSRSIRYFFEFLIRYIFDLYLANMITLPGSSAIQSRSAHSGVAEHDTKIERLFQQSTRQSCTHLCNHS